MGETLTARTSGIADTEGFTNVSFSYQWIRNCDAPGAICTGDGRKLSDSLDFTVSGPS